MMNMTARYLKLKYRFMLLNSIQKINTSLPILKKHYIMQVLMGK